MNLNMLCCDVKNQQTIILLHDFEEYKNWMGLHYHFNIFRQEDVFALLIELEPEEFPCLAFFYLRYV